MNSEQPTTDLRLAPQFRTALVLLGTVLISGNLYLSLQSADSDPVDVVRSGDSIGVDTDIARRSKLATTASKEETQDEEIVSNQEPDIDSEDQDFGQARAPSTPVQPAVSLEPTPTLMAAQTELERRRAAAIVSAQIDTTSSAQTTGENPWISILERISR